MADGRETSGWVIEDERPHCGSCGSLMHFDEGLFCPNMLACGTVLLAERDRLREVLVIVATRLEDLPNGHGHLPSYTAGIASYARDALNADSHGGTDEN